MYLKIRRRLSQKNRGRLSKFLILSGLKPAVNHKVISPFDEGIVVFSADFEMAWAYRYSKKLSSKAVEWGLKERKNIPVIIDLLERYNIPVTWATVGHLFLNECTHDYKCTAHPDMPRPDYFENRNWKFESGDWYEHDPCTNIESDPAWYASDLIERILEAKVNHEIGCHTYSHLDFTYNNCPKELADAELGACINVAEMKGIELKSMVFPGGTFGNFESLKEKGLKCYRKPMRYHIDLPIIDMFGLVAIPSSICLNRDPYGWTKEFHIKMIRKFLEKATKYKLVCHLWFHPSMDPWYLENVMPEVVKLVAKYRNNGLIRISTMGELADIMIGHVDAKE